MTLKMLEDNEDWLLVNDTIREIKIKINKTTIDIAGIELKYMNDTTAGEIIAYPDNKSPVASIIKKINSRELAYREIVRGLIVFQATLIN